MEKVSGLTRYPSEGQRLEGDDLRRQARLAVTRAVAENSAPAPPAVVCRTDANSLAQQASKLWHPGSEWSGAKAIIYANTRDVISKAALYRT
jgi:hypothetical protein